MDARRHNRSVDHPQTQQHNRSHFLDARRALRRSRGRGRRGLLDDRRHIRLQVQNVVARIEAIESTIQVMQTPPPRHDSALRAVFLLLLVLKVVVQFCDVQVILGAR